MSKEVQSQDAPGWVSIRREEYERLLSFTTDPEPATPEPIESLDEILDEYIVPFSTPARGKYIKKDLEQAIEAYITEREQDVVYDTWVMALDLAKRAEIQYGMSEATSMIVSWCNGRLTQLQTKEQQDA